MEYQKIIHLLDNTLNQPSKFRTRNWVEINGNSRETCNTNSQIKFETSVLKSNLCDYSDTHIHVKGTITVPNRAAATATANYTGRKVTFKNCSPITDCISEINNTQADNAKDIDVVIPIYKLIEYSYIYSEKLGILWQYYRDEPGLDNNNNVIDIPSNKNIIAFIFKEKTKGQNRTKHFVLSNGSIGYQVTSYIFFQL